MKPESDQWKTYQHTDVSSAGHDHVVENRDSAQVADLAQALGELDVLLRRVRNSAGMVVHEDHG